jgi:hypothetical protein
MRQRSKAGGTTSAPGPFKVFAPTNDAFAALLAELGVTKAQLLADKALLSAFVRGHRRVDRRDVDRARLELDGAPRPRVAPAAEPLGVLA